ncbi:MAG: 3-methyl-2-oxobutanoate dehydrogenase subunit beta [Pseudomonadota bacterium]
MTTDAGPSVREVSVGSGAKVAAAGAAPRAFLEGGHALAEAAIQAGCRFYCGYPMTPSTEVLEYMARRMPEVGGVCINVESEIEGINMVWGAAGAGVRAMIASTTNGMSLMQESLSEVVLGRIPAVVVNMGRGQGDYFQCTRGGGHGSHRMIVLAPASAQEAVDTAYRAFHLAEKWRHPVLIYGDFILSHTSETVCLTPPPDTLEPLPEKTWATTGARGRPPRLLTSLGMRSEDAEPHAGIGPGEHGVDTTRPMREAVERHREIAARETRVETAWLDDAELVVSAFGVLGRFARFAAKLAREEGLRVGYVRPYTLVPFPYAKYAELGARGVPVAVFENNAGQMVQDVRLGVEGRAPVHFIGEISMDGSGFGVGPKIDALHILERLREVYPRRSAA